MAKRLSRIQLIPDELRGGIWANMNTSCCLHQLMEPGLYYVCRCSLSVSLLKFDRKADEDHLKWKRWAVIGWEPLRKHKLTSGLVLFRTPDYCPSERSKPNTVTQTRRPLIRDCFSLSHACWQRPVELPSMSQPVPGVAHVGCSTGSPV